ncbi:MAG: hypothetical protein RLZZ535_1489 [Cyanobacteriota bacterium]|jgi:hypothetical protein
MTEKLIRIFVFISIFLNCSFVAGQNKNSDQEIYSKSRIVISNENIEIYQDEVNVDENFLHLVDEASKNIQIVLQRKFDKTVLGKKIKIVVSKSVRISHVWHGYQHIHDPKGILFLNSKAYSGFLNGSNATLLHELTHLLMWKYESHSLREGLADYVAKKVMPYADIGPNSYGVEFNILLTHLAPYLGSKLEPQSDLLSDMNYRKEYYLGSYKFVSKLIELKSLEIFLTLYESLSTDEQYIKLYGSSRADLVCNLVFINARNECLLAVK